MIGMLESKTELYINSLLPAREKVLREMERYAERHDVPIVGPACGRMLYQLARLIKARRVFEMGSAIGYSTLWLAQAVGPKGTVYYTDGNPSNAARARENLRRAGVLSRVRLLVGDALELFKKVPGRFDFIFSDVTKTQYPEVFRLTVPRVREGGLFVTDNVLWSGRAARPAEPNDVDTVAIQEFNRTIYRARNLFTTIVPLRDGLAVCLKCKSSSAGL